MITVLMTACSMVSKAYFMFQVQNTWLIWTCVAATLFIEIYIFCCDGARTFPANMIFLGVFTFCEGYIVSFIASATGQQEGNSVVLLAAFMTMGTYFVYVSCCDCLHSVCLLHWVRLHHFLTGGDNIVGDIARVIYRHHVHQLSIHQKFVLRSRSVAILNLPDHWHADDYGRQECRAQSWLICPGRFVIVHRYHSDLLVHSPALVQ